jgi:hypothetical protein
MDQPAPPDRPAYEFTPEQNTLIGQLAAAMHWVSAPLLFVGFLYAAAGVLAVVQAFSRPHAAFTALYTALAAAFFLVLGNWTKKSAMAFQDIVTTTGRDVRHLMEALDNLRKTYTLLSLLVKLYLVLLLFAVVAAVLLAIFGTFQTAA